MKSMKKGNKELMANLNLPQTRLSHISESSDFSTLPECTSKLGYVGTCCVE